MKSVRVDSPYLCFPAILLGIDILSFRFPILKATGELCVIYKGGSMNKVDEARHRRLILDSVLSAVSHIVFEK